MVIQYAYIVGKYQIYLYVLEKRVFDMLFRLVLQHVQIVFNGVFCEVLAYNVTVSFCRST